MYYRKIHERVHASRYPRSLLIAVLHCGTSKQMERLWQLTGRHHYFPLHPRVATGGHSRKHEHLFLEHISSCPRLTVHTFPCIWASLQKFHDRRNGASNYRETWIVEYLSLLPAAAHYGVLTRYVVSISNLHFRGNLVIHVLAECEPSKILRWCGHWCPTIFNEEWRITYPWSAA